MRLNYRKLLDKVVSESFSQLTPEDLYLSYTKSVSDTLQKSLNGIAASLKLMDKRVVGITTSGFQLTQNIFTEAAHSLHIEDQQWVVISKVAPVYCCFIRRAVGTRTPQGTNMYFGGDVIYPSWNTQLCYEQTAIDSIVHQHLPNYAKVDIGLIKKATYPVMLPWSSLKVESFVADILFGPCITSVTTFPKVQHE